jgi:hypothetical protein
MVIDEELLNTIEIQSPYLRKSSSNKSKILLLNVEFE